MEKDELKRRFENEPVIIDHSKKSDLIFMYFNPRNFQESELRKQNLTFDCDKYIVANPPWMENTKVAIRSDPHPKTGKITDTIAFPDDWYTLEEWTKNSENPRSLLRRIFTVGAESDSR